MKLLVLAGGFGTRLQSAVSGVPKALAPVCGVPFLHWQIENWIDQGVRSFVFLLHHQADLIIAFLQKEQAGLFEGCEVSWVTEPVPMGTGGALAYAVSQLGIFGDFLVVNADTWLETGMGDVSQADSPAMVVVHVENAGRYGSVLCDGKNFITAFHEKSPEAGAGLINAGLCHLNAELFSNWNQEPFSLESTSFPTWAARDLLRAVPVQTNFIDLGIPEDYFRFCRWIESGKIGVP